MYKILVLGNGFDLACGLPTRYTDFLYFIQQLSSETPISDVQLDIDIRKIIDRKRKDNANELDSIREKIRTNVWIQHFLCVESRLPADRKWMDFETEMARVINTIDGSRKDALSQNHMYDENESMLDFPSKLNNYPWIFSFAEEENKKDISTLLFQEYQLHPEANLKELIDYRWKRNDLTPGMLDRIQSINLCTYNKIRENLVHDLQELTEILEYYLKEFVSKEKIKQENLSETIIDTLHWFGDEVRGVRRILLTFNYTDTYERLIHQLGLAMPDRLQICHIHGRVGEGNIVLGFDDSNNDDTFWSQCEKYYQKIYRKVDGSFYDFSRSTDYWQDDHEVRIIGHSFAMSDKHPLEKILNMPNSKLCCYYYKDSSEIIRNIAGIIGKDAISEKSLGKEGTIIFLEIEGKRT